MTAKNVKGNRPSRTMRRRNTKRIAGRPIAKQPGRNGGKRTAVKRKEK